MGDLEYAAETRDVEPEDAEASYAEMRALLEWLTTPNAGLMPDVVLRIRAVLAKNRGE